MLSFLLGWFGNQLIQIPQVTAATPVEYKVVRLPEFFPGDYESGRVATSLENFLNTYAKQGWKFHTEFDDHAIFER